MAQLNAVDFLAKWATLFADNTTGEISAEDMRDFRQDIIDSFPNFLDDAYEAFTVAAGGTNTYAATLSPAITAYSATHKYFVKFTNANSGASTLNLNTLGAKSIVKNGAAALESGDIAAGQIYMLAYDGTNLQIMGRVTSGAIGGSTGATDNAILRADGIGGSTLQNSPVTINDAGDVTLPNDKAIVITPTSGNNMRFTGDSSNRLRLENGGQAALIINNLAETSIGDDFPTSGVKLTVSDGGGTNGGDDPVIRIKKSVTGASAINNGTSASIDFEIEAQQGNHEVASSIRTVLIDNTSTSEDFDLVFYTMAAGAAISERARINSNGLRVTGKFYLNSLNTAPANASDTGTAGEIRIDASHIYVCTAANTWKRVAIATW